MEKAFNTNQIPIHDFFLSISKLEIQENFQNLIKDIYEIPTANVVEDNAYTLRLQTRQRYLFSAIGFDIVLEMLMQ